MTASPAPDAPDSSVATPGTIKTLGWLNIAFGAVLMLCFTCIDGYMVILPSGMRMIREQQKVVQAKQQAARDAEIQAIRVQEDQAETSEQKASLRAERIVLETMPLDNVPPPTVDLSALGLDDPRVRAHYAIDGVTCWFVNTLMIVAGIGLIRLKSWGRRLAIWVAVLKLVRLALVGASMLFVVYPVTNAGLLQGGAPDGKAAQNGSWMTMTVVTSLITLTYVAVCAAYPIVLLVLLTRPGARAAVAKPTGYSDSSQ